MNDSKQATLAEIRRLRLLPCDPFWQREIAERLGKGERLQYLANRGVSVDAMLQHLQGEGMLPLEMDAIGFLAWFDSALQERRGAAHKARFEGRKRSSSPDTDFDAEAAQGLAHYHAHEQTAPETEKERKNKNRRHECASCGAIVWYSGIPSRFACASCLCAALLDALGESATGEIIARCATVYAPIDGVSRKRSKPIPPHIRRAQSEAIPF